MMWLAWQILKASIKAGLKPLGRKERAIIKIKQQPFFAGRAGAVPGKSKKRRAAMQPWDHVTVQKEGDANFGKAGIVRQVKGGEVIVKLDDDQDGAGALVGYTIDELKVLGR